jgi:hypothetical protein
MSLLYLWWRRSLWWSDTLWETLIRLRMHSCSLHSCSCYVKKFVVVEISWILVFGDILQFFNPNCISDAAPSLEHTLQYHICIQTSILWRAWTLWIPNISHSFCLCLIMKTYDCMNKFFFFFSFVACLLPLETEKKTHLHRWLIVDQEITKEKKMRIWSIGWWRCMNGGHNMRMK